MNVFVQIYIKMQQQKNIKIDTQQKRENIQDGFSSDSEVFIEKNEQENHELENEQQTAKQLIKLSLPRPQEVRSKSYSLQPDIQTGWTMKKQLPKPIPLLFDSNLVDNLVNKSIKTPSFKSRLIYLGPRYQSTHLAWLQKSFNNPYQHIPTPVFPKFSRREFCGQKRGLPVDMLVFDSKFESGNLDAVFKVGLNEYQLFLRVDSNTRGHIQWFNFTVKNMKKGEKYLFHICNFNKKSSLYTRGAKPYFFSKCTEQYQKIKWRQYGQVKKYQQMTNKSMNHYDIQPLNYYKLSFTFEAEYDNDEIQIAYSIPYTYSQLNSFIQNLVQKQRKNYLKISKLCNTLGGLEVPLIVVDGTQQCKNKKCIVISGRAHPGESNSSYMMQGFIEFLCGKSKVAEKLRKKVLFKIVPMLNPDGVVIGNHRTGVSGKDFNRDFSSPNIKISPEVYAIKKLVGENKQIFGDNLLMFLDFHGHSVKKNVFMYGPQFSITNKYYYQSREFPKLLGEVTRLFRFYSCIFKISEVKQSTARVVLLRKFRIPLSFTIQASNGSYYNHEILADVPFTTIQWALMGQKIAEALQIYTQNLRQKQKLKEQKLKSNRNTQKSTKNRIKNSQIYNVSSKAQKRSINKTDQSQYEPLSNVAPYQKEDVQKLVKQINKVQKRRQKNIVSDDQVSQSSSDVEDQRQDLSLDKLNLLYSIIKTKNNGSLTYDPKQISLFLQQRKEQTRQPIWMRKIKQKGNFSFDESRKNECFSSNNYKDKIKNTTRRFSNQISIKQKQKKGVRVVSFGTSYIDFDTNPQQKNENRAQRIYQQLLAKKNYTMYLKAGFVPSGKILQTDRLRKNQVSSALNSHQIYQITPKRSNQMNSDQFLTNSIEKQRSYFRNLNHNITASNFKSQKSPKVQNQTSINFQRYRNRAYDQFRIKMK